jgi:hypothetical protein
VSSEENEIYKTAIFKIETPKNAVNTSLRKQHQLVQTNENILNNNNKNTNNSINLMKLNNNQMCKSCCDSNLNEKTNLMQQSNAILDLNQITHSKSQNNDEKILINAKVKHRPNSKENGNTNAMKTKRKNVNICK